jgi:hypothetical protein
MTMALSGVPGSVFCRLGVSGVSEYLTSRLRCMSLPRLPNAGVALRLGAVHEVATLCTGDEEVAAVDPSP